jgi:hypothetical protein
MSGPFASFRLQRPSKHDRTGFRKLSSCDIDFSSVVQYIAPSSETCIRHLWRESFSQNIISASDLTKDGRHLG